MGSISSVSVPDVLIVAASCQGAYTHGQHGLTGSVRSEAYTYKIDPQYTQVGTAQVTVYEVPNDISASTTIGGSATRVTIGTPGQNGIVSFTGSAGQRVIVKGLNSTMTTHGVTLRVNRPDGTFLKSITFTGTSGQMTSTTLPVSGTYTVKVDPTFSQIGSIDVQAVIG